MVKVQNYEYNIFAGHTLLCMQDMLVRSTELFAMDQWLIFTIVHSVFLMNFIKTS